MMDDEFLQLYPHVANEELMKLLDCSRATLQRRARRLGVRKSPEHQSQVQAARMLGRQLSPASRAKISEKAQGRAVAPETTARRVATLQANGQNRGPNHYRWAGGQPWKRFADPAYIAWRNAVLERDSYCCQDCKRRCAKYEKGLAAHHLKSYAKHPDLRLDVDNGITLCRQCHMARHGRAPAPKTKIPCACGCAEMIDPVDRYGRPRRYINHHHQKAQPPAPRARPAKQRSAQPLPRSSS